MSINLCVLVSSKVVLLPSLADTRACTRGSVCSSKALNSSSVLANAHASLPVLALILVGGTMPKAFSNSANRSLLIRSSMSACAESSSLALRFLTFSKCSSNIVLSKTNDGCINIFRVVSITFNSFVGKVFASILKMS